MILYVCSMDWWLYCQSHVCIHIRREKVNCPSSPLSIGLLSGVVDFLKVWPKKYELHLWISWNEMNHDTNHKQGMISWMTTRTSLSPLWGDVCRASCNSKLPVGAANFFSTFVGRHSFILNLSTSTSGGMLNFLLEYCRQFVNDCIPLLSSILWWPMKQVYAFDLTRLPGFSVLDCWWMLIWWRWS